MCAVYSGMWQGTIVHCNLSIHSILLNSTELSIFFLYFCWSRLRHIGPISRLNIHTLFVVTPLGSRGGHLDFSPWKETKSRGKATSFQTYQLIRTRISELLVWNFSFKLTWFLCGKVGLWLWPSMFQLKSTVQSQSNQRHQVVPQFKLCTVNLFPRMKMSWSM